MLTFLKALSPSTWVIVALSVALLAASVSVKIQTSRLANCKAEMVELESRVNFQNQKIDMFRAEAALMGQSLTKHKKIAADLRATSKKKVREIAKQPVVKECHKAVAASTRAAQRRLHDALNDYPDNTRDE